MDYGEILGIRKLITTAEAQRFPELMLQDRVPEEGIEGDLAEWDIEYVNKVLQNNFVSRDAKAKPSQFEKLGHKTANCLHSFFFNHVPAGKLRLLRQPGTERERNARAWITRLQRDMRRRHGALVDEWMLWEALKGSLTAAYEGVNVAIDYEIPTTHKPTASASWATTTTDIFADIETWSQLIVEDSGRMPTTMFFNSSVLPYLYKNDLVKSYLASTNVGTQIVQDGRVSRLFGLNLVQWDAAYVNGSGTTTKFIPDNMVLIVPDFSEDWIQMLRGEVVIPTEDGEDFQYVREGWYTEVTRNPVGMHLYYKTCRIPALKVPAAVVYADVIP